MEDLKDPLKCEGCGKEGRSLSQLKKKDLVFLGDGPLVGHWLCGKCIIQARHRDLVYIRNKARQRGLDFGPDVAPEKENVNLPDWFQ